MILNVLMSVSGPQNIRCTHVKTIIGEHDDYEFYQIDKWAEDEYSPGVLIKFPNGVITQICSPREFPRIEEMIDKGVNLFKFIGERLDVEIEKAKEGVRRTIPVHWAKGLDRVDEVEKAQAEFDRIKAEREAKKQEEERLADEKRREEMEKRLDEAEKNFLEGEYIDSGSFECLLERFEIKVPLRTLGWIRERLNSIRESSYIYTGSRKNQSSKVGDLQKQLYAALSEKHGVTS